MAVTYVTGQAATNDGGGVTSLTLTAFEATGSNRLVIAGVGTSAGTPPDWTNCRWGGSSGTAMTDFGTRTTSLPAFCGMRGFYLKDASLGTGSKQVYASGSATDECGVVAVAYSDVDQTTTFGTLATDGNQNGAARVTVSSATGELIVGWAYHADSAVADATDDASQTRRQTSVGVTYECIVSSEKAGAASTTFGYTVPDGADYGHVLQAISVKPSTGGGVKAFPPFSHARNMANLISL